MPAERRDAGGELGYPVEPDRHAALVVHVEPDAARALGVERGHLVRR